MKKDKSFILLFFMVFAVAVFGVLACFFLLNEQSQLQDELDHQKMLREVQEGTVFTLRDDIAVLQDSLRLIRTGDIKIEKDTIKK